MIKFVILGKPQGKDRPRWGKHGMYTTDKTKVYEQAIKLAFQSAAGGMWFADKPVSVSIAAFYPIPKGTSKVKAKLMLAKEIRPVVKPDIDNICKVVLDGLNGVAFADDKQVQSLSVSKWYSDQPRVEVEIMEF